MRLWGNVTTFLLCSSGAKADVTISVSPSLLEIGLDPGAGLTQAVTVKNRGSDAAYVTVGVVPYAGDRQDIEAVEWFEVDPLEFDLEPGVSQEVIVTVAAPSDAKPGGHYAAVSFRTSARPPASAAQRFTGGTGVGATIGCVFLLTVRGADLKLEGQLTKVVPVSAGPGRLGARVEITNTGNVHMFPEGQVELRDLDGNVIGIFELPETTAILPGETQSLYLEGVQDVQDGAYRASGTIQYGWNSEQTKAAAVEYEEWGHQEDSKEIVFNSVPKLRVVEVRMEGSSENGAEIKLSVENYGDVEVSPAGFVDVLNSEGERAALLNIGAGSWPVEPHSTASREYVFRDAIPKGDYSLAAKLNYHGEETAAGTAIAHIEQDIVPPVAPEAPEARKLQYAPSGPRWIWAALAGVAAVAVASLGAAVWAMRRLAFRPAAAPRDVAREDPPESDV